MDTTAMNMWKEAMRKETKFAKKWQAENALRMGDEDEEMRPIDMLRSMQAQRRPKSSAEHFIDQTLGVSKNPFDKMGAGYEGSRPNSPEILYFGVSGEGKGRAAYLNRRKEKGPQEKFGRPVTTAQMVGWSTPTIQTGSSPFAHRPLIKSTFYRNNGVFRNG